MDIRFRFFIVLMMGLLIGAVWTFPQWYPLLNDDTISEAYGGLPLDAQASYVALPPDVQRAFETLRDGDEDLDQEPRPDVALALVEARLLSENVVTSEEEQAFTPPSETILRRGTFRQIDPFGAHKATSPFTKILTSRASCVLKTSPAPAPLMCMLSSHAIPTPPTKQAWAWIILTSARSRATSVGKRIASLIASILPPIRLWRFIAWNSITSSVQPRCANILIHNSHSHTTQRKIP
jgi:hypothetical protein